MKKWEKPIMKILGVNMTQFEPYKDNNGSPVIKKIRCCECGKEIHVGGPEQENQHKGNCSYFKNGINAGLPAPLCS